MLLFVIRLGNKYKNAIDIIQIEEDQYVLK
jgi:hypothetical protein